MEFISIPVIVTLCYLIGDIYKVLFRNKKDMYKLIPVLLTLMGGVIGVVLFQVDETYLGVNSIVSALEIGMISGAASTGTHQMLKKIRKKEGEEKLCNKD